MSEVMRGAIISGKTAGLLISVIVLMATPLFLFVPPALAAPPTYQTSATGTGDSGSAIVSKPSGTVQNDLLVAGIMLEKGSDITITAPAGWTLIRRNNQGTNNGIGTYYKVAGASEGASYTFNFSQSNKWAAGITRISNVDTSNPINVSNGSTGSSGNPSAPSATTTVDDTLVLAYYSNKKPTTYTSAGGTTERYDAPNTTNGLPSNMMATFVVASAGASGAKTATPAETAEWTAQQVAVARVSIVQSSYRFLMNLDAADPRFVVSNPSSSDDTITDAVIDTNNGVFFTVGHSSSNWLIEKRSELDGSLITGFGTNGQIIQDVASSNTEQAYGVAVDSSEGYIYIVGSDRVPGVNDAQWRIEKRDMNNGNLDTNFGSSGVIQSNIVNAKDDEAVTVVLDTANDYLYAAGYDANSAEQWHIEKRRTSDGALCTAANCGTEFGTGGIITQNLSGGIDRVKSMAIDPSGESLYLAGQDSGTGNTAWRVEKRRTSDGALCTAANCGTQFGTNGVYTSNPTNGADGITQFQVDSPGNAIYVGGYDNTGGRQWRIEKLNATTGALVTAFGTSGVVTSNPSAGSDEIVDLDLDGAGGYVFVIGFDANGSNQRWRIEKRNRSDGQLVSAFGTSGVLNSDPSSNNEAPGKIMIDIDRSFFWAVGGDRTLGASNMRWRFEQYQLDNAEYWLSATDTAGAVSTNITFRLRMLLHTTADLLSSVGMQFKLQYAPKIGTCDTAFTGETYTDINGGSEIQYHDNPSLSDGDAIVSLTGDPSHSTHTTVLQSIEEANNFTNPNNITAGNDGMWDFVMKDSNAFGAYCFRAVYSDGTLLDTYTVIPELSFCKDDPKTENVLRHGAYFCEGLEKPFFWAKD